MAVPSLPDTDPLFPMPDPDAKTLIYPDLAAFMQGGVSIMIASRGIQNLPSVVRALGCRVLPDQRRIRVLVPVLQSQTLLQDVRATGRVAVVFSKPTTHQALQFKAEDAVVTPLEDEDLSVVEGYRQAWIAEVGRIGYPAEGARAILTCAPSVLAPIVFTPETGFVQTPGPEAGAPMPRRA